MRELTATFVRKALKTYRVWDLGNDVLYRLCADHPGHAAEDVIIAKFWLIGRSYAAAVERRRSDDKLTGDAFYQDRLAPALRESGIDAWIQELRNDTENSRDLNLEVHKRLVDLLEPITELKKRSLVSKYLHFHFPARFFIYDARAARSIKQLVPWDEGPKAPVKYANIDAAYAAFVWQCEQLAQTIGVLTGQTPSPRDLDKVLLLWNDTVS